MVDTDEQALLNEAHALAIVPSPVKSFPVVLT
jgi:hypothetical protein